MSSCNKPTKHFFASSGGIAVPADDPRDPLEALDDLMVVVEALCPAWPQRDTFENAGQLRL